MLLPSGLLLFPCPMVDSTAKGTEGQRQPVDADPFLAELARGLQCCFAGIPHAKEQERQQNFLQCAQMAKKLHIAVPSNGLNFHLCLCSVEVMQDQNESELFFNGLPIRLRGQVNMRNLSGNVEMEHLQNHEPNSRFVEAAEKERKERLERRFSQMRDAVLRL